MSAQEQIINDLIAQLGLADLPAEQLAELKKSLNDRIEHKLMVDIMANLTDEQRQLVAKKLEDGVNMVEVLEYLSSVMPNFVEVLQASMVAAQEEIKADMKKIDDNIQEQAK
jgi:hypothetical protein